MPRLRARRHRDDLRAEKLQLAVDLGELAQARGGVRQREQDEQHGALPAQLLQAARRGGAHREREVGRGEPGAAGLDQRAQAARLLARGERAEEIDHVPAVLRREGAAERGHAPGGDAVGEPPEEIARGVLAGMGRGEIRGAPRQPRAAGAVPRAASAMAGRAVRAVQLDPARDRRRLIRDGRAQVRGRIGVDGKRRQGDPEPGGDGRHGRGQQERGPSLQDEGGSAPDQAQHGDLGPDEEPGLDPGRLRHRVIRQAVGQGPVRRIVARRRGEREAARHREDQRGQAQLPGDEAGEVRHRRAADGGGLAGERGQEPAPAERGEPEDRHQQRDLGEEQPAIRRADQGGHAADLHPGIPEAGGDDREHDGERDRWRSGGPRAPQTAARRRPPRATRRRARGPAAGARRATRPPRRCAARRSAPPRGPTARRRRRARPRPWRRRRRSRAPSPPRARRSSPRRRSRARGGARGPRAGAASRGGSSTPCRTASRASGAARSRARAARPRGRSPPPPGRRGRPRRRTPGRRRASA